MNMSLGVLKYIIFFFLIFFSLILKAKPIEGSVVKIQILDKITTQLTIINIEVNDSIEFESLSIKIYGCYTNPPEKVPEDFVLLKIYDLINSKNKELIYQGWMISSSPSTTPLEHPIYDLWIKDCKIETEL